MIVPPKIVSFCRSRSKCHVLVCMKVCFFKTIVQLWRQRDLISSLRIFQTRLSVDRRQMQRCSWSFRVSSSLSDCNGTFTQLTFLFARFGIVCISKKLAHCNTHISVLTCVFFNWIFPSNIKSFLVGFYSGLMSFPYSFISGLLLHRLLRDFLKPKYVLFHSSSIHWTSNGFGTSCFSNRDYFELPVDISGTLYFLFLTLVFSTPVPFSLEDIFL